MSDSDDGLSPFPVSKRGARAQTKGGSGGARSGSSDSDSPEPEWFAKFTAPKKAAPDVMSLMSDSDDDVPIAKAVAAAEPSSGRPGRVAAKKEPVIDLSDSDDDKDVAKLVAKSSTSPQTKVPDKLSKKGEKPPLGGKKKSAGARSAAAAAVGVTKATASDIIKHASQTDTQSEGGGSQQPEGSQASGGLAAVVKGDVPVMMPEKVSANKVLMELEDRHGPDGLGAADLSGDSGAVGRLLVSSAADDGQPPGLMVDLKGSLYNVTVAPLQGTVCVVSVGQAEAKVEGLVHSFLQLREESNLSMGEAIMEGVFDFNDDDDDPPTTFGGLGEEKGNEGGKAGAKGKGAKGKASAKAKPKQKGKPKAAGKAKAGAKKPLGKKSGGVKKK
uniref:DNA-binding protein BIN4 n=1 Tax=Tetraselmis chuii TaxID=63592 RepID=A0A7S1STA4_9CHLO|mmetsp:Transcript_28468/g.50851  ORF Transcript_28468/g.50851 Transcript_28468/m.50851 type:complete len:386 (+) Transcript_28468:291-1448(+)